MSESEKPRRRLVLEVFQESAGSVILRGKLQVRLREGLPGLGRLRRGKRKMGSEECCCWILLVL